MQFLDSEVSDASTVHLGEYVDLLKRRRWTVLLVLALAVLVGAVISLHTQPVYESTAELLVDNAAGTTTTSQVNADNPLVGLLAPDAPQSLGTQIELLQDSPLVDQAVAENGPATLAITAVPDTNIIQVTADAPTAAAAAGVPNTLLRLYVHDRAEKSLADINSAIDFAGRQRAAAAAQLARADAALLRFQQGNAVGDVAQSRSAEIERVEGLKTDRNALAKTLASDDQQIARLQALAGSAPGMTDQADRAANPAITQLESEINTLKVQRAGMVQPGGFTAKAPQVLNIDAQIAAYEQQLAQQPRAVDLLKGEAATTSAELAEDDRLLSSETARLTQYAGLGASVDQLTGDRDGAASKLKMFNDAEQSLILREKAYRADSHIVQLAAEPLVPTRPNKKQNLLFAVAVGLLLGVCAALAQEFLDDRMQSAGEAQRVLGLPTIGRIPLAGADAPRLLSTARSRDFLSESFRLLRANIGFASAERPLRTLVVTSSGVGEGKTTTVANIAIAMAMDGKRVTIVDADLRRPSLHKLLGAPSTPGLTDVLAGEVALDDVWLEHSRVEALSFVTAGTPTPNPAELLGSRAFAALIETLKEQSDIVLIDSPPTLVADAQILASRMDATLIVVEPGRTTKSRARHCLELLERSRANVIGMAINKADVARREYMEYRQYAGVDDPALEKPHPDRPRLTGPVNHGR